MATKAKPATAKRAPSRAKAAPSVPFTASPLMRAPKSQSNADYRAAIAPVPADLPVPVPVPVAVPTRPRTRRAVGLPATGKPKVARKQVARKQVARKQAATATKTAQRRAEADRLITAARADGCDNDVAVAFWAVAHGAPSGVIVTIIRKLAPRITPQPEAAA